MKNIDTYVSKNIIGTQQATVGGLVRTTPGTPWCRQEKRLCGQPCDSALVGQVLVWAAENQLKTPLS